MLFDEKYLREKNGKIDFSDFTKSRLDEILGCVSYIFPIILQALQDRLSMENQSIEQSGEFTIINESFSGSSDFNEISEYKFLLAPIEHTVWGEKEKYDAHSYIEQAKTDGSLLKNRIMMGHVRGMMRYLANNGVDIKYIKNTIIYKL